MGLTVIAVVLAFAGSVALIYAGIYLVPKEWPRDIHCRRQAAGGDVPRRLRLLVATDGGALLRGRQCWVRWPAREGRRVGMPEVLHSDGVRRVRRDLLHVFLHPRVRGSGLRLWLRAGLPMWPRG